MNRSRGRTTGSFMKSQFRMRILGLVVRNWCLSILILAFTYKIWIRVLAFLFLAFCLKRIARLIWRNRDIISDSASNLKQAAVGRLRRRDVESSQAPANLITVSFGKVEDTRERVR